MNEIIKIRYSPLDINEINNLNNIIHIFILEPKIAYKNLYNLFLQENKYKDYADFNIFWKSLYKEAMLTFHPDKNYIHRNNFLLKFLFNNEEVTKNINNLNDHIIIFINNNFLEDYNINEWNNNLLDIYNIYQWKLNFQNIITLNIQPANKAKKIKCSICNKLNICCKFNNDNNLIYCIKCFYNIPSHHQQQLNKIKNKNILFSNIFNKNNQILDFWTTELQSKYNNSDWYLTATDVIFYLIIPFNDGLDSICTKCNIESLCCSILNKNYPYCASCAHPWQSLLLKN